MPGSVTKGGERCAAYLCGEKVDMAYMNSFVFDEFKVKRFAYKSVLPLAVAKKISGLVSLIPTGKPVGLCNSSQMTIKEEQGDSVTALLRTIRPLRRF